MARSTHPSPRGRRLDIRTALRTWFPASAAVLCVAGCSDAHVTQTPAFADRYPSATQTGVFKPGNVAGLDFVSGAHTGVTDTTGHFTCATDQPVAFAIGKVALGNTACATVAHPAALTASGSLLDPAAINITRFLLLLDHDQAFDNGVQISEALRSLAAGWPQIDFSAADFESELVTVMSDIASTEGRTSVVVPTSAEALADLDASLSCAYSGVFVNTFVAGLFFAPTHAAIRVYRDPTSGNDVFDARIKRSHPQSQLYVYSAGTVALQTLPSLAGGPSNGLGNVSADYRSPDLISGAWTDAGGAQQTIDRAGFFEVVRIGQAAGDYRFTGTFTRTASGLVGLATMTLDGDTLAGEAFDLSNGAAFSVSGTRLPNSNSVELRTRLATEPSTVELLTDANGAPVSLKGPWPGTEAASLDAVGCRLN